VTVIPAPNFDHLLDMTTDVGTFEHALFAEPRPEHGFCTDDMARVLVVATREPDPTPAVRHLAETSLRFLGHAQGFDGDYRNRMTKEGRWADDPTFEDCWGRSVWALGTAVTHSDTEWVRQSALSQFERAAHGRSIWPRARAFAALGAAEVLVDQPRNRAARDLLVDSADHMRGLTPNAAWPWPEARLTYANAVLPEAMIAAGASLSRPDLLQDGLDLLAWLVDHEMRDGRLSVTPVGGAGAGDAGPSFDQQPIEVAAIADACARAAELDPAGRWAEVVTAALAWFLGENDARVEMWDPATGGGFDGLEATGRNGNEGAESTLALLSTLQHARRLAASRR
jgi:hypothetical protein